MVVANSMSLNVTWGWEGPGNYARYHYNNTHLKMYIYIMVSYRLYFDFHIFVILSYE